MTQQLDYSSILLALERASAFDLFRLQQAIDRALQDPDRIVPVMAALHEGQETTFLDYQTNTEKRCTVESTHRKAVSVLMQEDNTSYRVPYYTLNVAGADINIRQQREASGMSRQELSVGAMVGFINSRNGEQITGTVERLNSKTVTIKTLDGGWRVGYSNLFPVYDGDASAADGVIQGQLIHESSDDQSSRDDSQPEQDVVF